MKKRILGLAVMLGVILSLSASAFAATKSIYTPKFTTTKLTDATAGKTYKQDIVVEVESSDAAWAIELQSPTITVLESTYNLTFAEGTTDSKANIAPAKGDKKGTYTLKNKGSDPVFRDTKALKIKIKATNHGESVEKEYTLKIAGTAPAFTAPTNADLGKTYFDSNSGNNWTQRGVGVVGKAFPTGDKAIKIQAGTGTLPIKMTATGLVNGLSAAQTYGSLDANVTEAKGKTAHTESGKVPQLTITGTPTKAGKMTVKVTAENATKSASGSYTLTILDSPDITTTKLTDATYGKEYKATLAGKGGDKNYPLAWYATSGLPTGFKVNSADGTITGTISKDAVVFKQASADATYNVVVKAVSYADKDYPKDSSTAVVATKTIPLKIKANKPVFISADTFTKNTLVLSASVKLEDSLKKSDNSKLAPVVNSSKIYIYVDTAAKFSVKGLPAGWTAAQVTSTDTATAENLKKGRGSYIEIAAAATPSTPVKSGKIEVTATNGAGKTTLSIPYKVDAAKPKIGAGATAAASATNAANGTVTTLKGQDSSVLSGTGAKSKKIGTSIDHYLTATPGPIKWKAEKLPKSVKLTTSGDTQAILKGKIDKEQGPTVWTITATNSVTGYTAVVSGELSVFSSPDLKTKKLGKVTTGKKSAIKIDLSGVSADLSKVTVNGGSETIIRKQTDVKNGNTTVGNVGVWSDDKGKLYVSADFSMIPANGGITLNFTVTNPAGMNVPKDLSLDVVGVAPKITTSKIFVTTENKKTVTTLKNGQADTTDNIFVTGTKPITVRAYIASKDVKKYGLGNEEKWIVFNKDTYTGGLTSDHGFKVDSADGTQTDKKGNVTSGTNIKLTAKPDFTAKGFPITVEVSSPASKGKWVKKTYKLDVSGSGVDWKYQKGSISATYENTVAGGTAAAVPAASKDITVYAVAGKASTAFAILTMSGDKPWQVTTKPTSGDTSDKGAINGLRVTGTGTTVTLGGTPTPGKETKSKATFTITNPMTKAKRAISVTVIALTPPVLSSKDYSEKGGVANVVESKDFQIGKKISITLKAKSGSKQGMTWTLTPNASGTGQSTTELGLDFDASTGKLTCDEAKVTTNKSGVFGYAIFDVKAKNDAGESATGKLYLGIRGAKFKIDTKKSTLTGYNSNAAQNSWGKIVTDPADAAKFTVDGDGIEGVTLGTDGTIGIAANQPAAKGATLKYIADNVGTIVKGQVKLNIKDAKPAPSAVTISATATDDAAVTATGTVDAVNATGDTKITWKIDGKPSDNKISVSVKADASDKTGKTATITVKVPKGYSGSFTSGTVKVIATNSSTKETGEATVTINVTPVAATNNSDLPEDNNALPEDEELTDKATEEEVAEETESEEAAEEGVTFGKARTEASLTAGQRAVIEEQGYIIAAVLPEMSVTKSGQYDIEAELSEKAPEGAKLVWFAFPKDVEPSEDDEIADFFDEEGAEIETVPASRKIVVAPWLEEGITYAPVIVVEADSAAGAKDTLEGAEAGDVVTEEALAAGAAAAE